MSRLRGHPPDDVAATSPGPGRLRSDIARRILSRSAVRRGPLQRRRSGRSVGVPAGTCQLVRAARPGTHEVRRRPAPGLPGVPQGGARAVRGGAGRGHRGAAGPVGRPSLAAHPQGAARASAAGRRGAQPEHEEVRFALQGRLLPGSRHREPVARGSARGDRHGPRAARRPVRAGRPWDGWGDRRDPPAVTDNVPGREPAGLSRGTTGLPDARVSPVRAAAARPARRRTNTGAIRVPRRGRR